MSGLASRSVVMLSVISVAVHGHRWHVITQWTVPSVIADTLTRTRGGFTSPSLPHPYTVARILLVVTTLRLPFQSGLCPRGHALPPRKLYLRTYGNAARSKGEARDGWQPVALWCVGCGLAYNVTPPATRARASLAAPRARKAHGKR